MKLWHQGPPEALPQSWHSDIPDVLQSVTDGWKARGTSQAYASGASGGRGSGFGLPGFISAFGMLLLQVRCFGTRCVVPKPQRTSALLHVDALVQKITFHERYKFLDGQYHKSYMSSPTAGAAAGTAPRREQLLEAAQMMLSVLTTLIATNVRAACLCVPHVCCPMRPECCFVSGSQDAAMGVIVRVFEYSRTHPQPGKLQPAPGTSASAGLAPGAARVTGPQPLTNGVGADEIAIVAGALPTLVVEGWGLFRACFELIQVCLQSFLVAWVLGK